MNTFFRALSLIIFAFFLQISVAQISAPSNCKSSPYPLSITQSDGTQITVIGKGNMNNPWTETTDGFSVVKNSNGVYEYAQKQNGVLIPTSVKANNPAQRNVTEVNYLSSLSKSLKPDFGSLKGSILSQVNAQIQNKTYPTTGNIRVLALLIDYPDLNNTYPVSNFDSLFSATNYRGGDESFSTFYTTASNGQLSITVDVYGWYRSANNYRYYGRDSGSTRAPDLVREAIDAAEAAGVDFSLYDNDGDFDADGILAVHAGPGAESGGQTQYIWSHRWVLRAGSLGSVTYDGVNIDDYMVNPETRGSLANPRMVGVGVFCHEFGHNLGLPDLYDTDDSNGDSEGIGNWGLMAGGSWLGGEHRPCNFSAWSREENGWDTPTLLTIGNSSSHTMNPASLNHNEMFRVNTPVASEYFLIENRQKTGLDLELPGEGLAIWHINTTKTMAFGNSVNADETLKGVDLEEADGNSDLDNETNRGDNGDLFPGSSNNNTFDDNSFPEARNYGFAPTSLQIRNITETGNQVSFDFGPASVSCSGLTTLTTPNGNFSDGSGAGNYLNNQNCTWLIQPAGASSITFGLTSLATEINNDRIRIYDGTSNTAPQIASYSGTNHLNTVTSSGGALFIEFTSNGTITDQGWDAFYTSSTGGAGCSGATTLTAANGSFSDGSGANNYDNNQFCSWLIQPPSGPITLSFSAFSTESNFDRVLVFDGIDNTAPQLGSFSGNSIPANLTSSGNNLYIEFRTNGTITDLGWDASYSTSATSCSGTTNLNGLNGVFDDGSGANVDYSDNLNCSWLIQPGAVQSIQITFDSMQTELGDVVSVYDGANNSAPLIGSYSGSNIPPILTTSGADAFVEFTTNGSVTDKGWQISYRGQNGCSGQQTFTAPSGTFTDGTGQFQNYFNNSNCSWLIQPPGATLITLDFNRFDTEQNFDFVRVYDGTSNTAPLIGQFDGIAIPTTINSSGGSLFVEFTSDASVIETGFEAVYNSTNTQCFVNQTFTANNGSFSDGSGTNNYSDNLNCSWLIQPPSVSSITLSFSAFDTENTNDIVNIYDGINNSGTLMASYSGSSIPANVIVNSNNMFIEFITNGSTTAQGWDANWTSVSTQSCSGVTNLTAPSGNFADGSGINFYDNGLSCGWLIQPSNSPLTITLTMNSINLANFGDRVSVYAGVNNSAPLVANFFMNNTGVPVTVSGNSMYVEFTTDNFQQANGWDASYNTSLFYCNPLTTMTAPNGIIEDGSPNGTDYLDNSDCSWLIQPTGSAGQAILLQFFNFATELGNDTVTIYDGTSAAAPILATYSGNIVPPNVTSSSNSMFITFKSNSNGIVDNGWRANYSVVPIPFCSGTTNFVAPNFTFDDGSPNGTNYQRNSNCYWLIQPPGALNIDVTFNRFQTQNNFDVVTVYDGSTTADPVLGTFSGNSLPPMLSGGGAVLVEFISNNFQQANGWEISYTSSNVPTLIASHDTVYINAAVGSTASFNVTSNTSWIMTDNVPWLIATPVSASGNQTANLSAILPNIGPERYGKVFLNGTTVHDTVVVVQRSSGNFLSTSPDTLFYTANPVSAQNITLNSNVNWNLLASQTWVTVNPTSGNGNANPSVTVTTNSGAKRTSFVLATGNLGVANDTVWIVQDGQVIPPHLNVNPKNISLNQAANSTANFDVRSNVVWQTSTPATWLTINNPANTMDTNTVSIEAITANTNPNARNTYVAVQDIAGTLFDTVFVSQAGTNLVLAANPDTVILGALTGSNTGAFLSSNTSWQTTLGASWFSLSPASGNGNVSLSITALSDNMSGVQQFSYIAIADISNSLRDTIVVVHDTVLNTIITSPDTIRIASPANSTNTFNVSTSLPWAANANASWLAVSPAGGTGNGVVTVTSNTANTSSTPRMTFVTATFTGGRFEEDTVWVVQDGLNNFLSVSPGSVNLNSSMGSNDNVSISSNVNWTVSNPVSWLTVAPANGTGNGTVSITANTDNLSGANRVATLAFSGTGVATQNVTVTQIDGSLPTFSVSTDTVWVNNPQGSQGSFDVLSNVNWSLSENTSWLLINPTSGNNVQSITVLAASRNHFGNPRFANITASAVGFNDTTVVVGQRSTVPLFQANPDKLIVGSDSADFMNFNLSSNLISWTVTENIPWADVSPMSGAFTQQIKVEANEQNNTGNIRTDFITISAPPLAPLSIQVTQDTIRSIGINENVLQNAVNIFPNPNNGEFNIELNNYTTDNLQLKVYNAVGSLVSTTVEPIGRNKARIRLNAAAGIYYLMLEIDNEIATKKILVVR